MHRFERVVEQSNDDVWLFCDLFSTLLLIFMLLINVPSGIKTSVATQSSSAKNNSSLSVNVTEQNLWQWQGQKPIQSEQAISMLAQARQPIVLYVSPKLDASKLYEVFSNLQQAQIEYSFTLGGG